MISVDEALARLFDLVAPLGTDSVPLRKAHGRVLATPVTARRSQPPFRASVMDGYAINTGGETKINAALVGEAAAGHPFARALSPGEAVRIFTGAPVPGGADRVVMQEDTQATDGHVSAQIVAGDPIYIRALGADFKVGDALDAPRRLGPGDVALIAAMNQSEVTVFRRPTVALLATGDELVMPGETPSEAQIIASNALGLAAICEQEGALPRILPIARDTRDSLDQALALASGSDLVVTIGGASVGDHDLVRQAAAARGAEQSFYKVAMRPGKPLMAGRIGQSTLLGLPGNPVSSMVCGHVFMRPVLRAMQGLPASPLPRRALPLDAPLAQNGGREHYMRASVSDGHVRPADRQDSALLSVLAASDALIVRPPNDPARTIGHSVDVIDL